MTNLLQLHERIKRAGRDPKVTSWNLMDLAKTALNNLAMTKKVDVILESFTPAELEYLKERLNRGK